MRRAPALFVVVGVLAGWAGLPAVARADGFWISLASGVAGSSTTSGYSEFWFDSPHAPPIAVTQATGAGTIQATTSGGSTYFTGEGTPVLLPTTDGYATLSSGSSFPAAALPRFAGGTQASGAPQGGGTIPSAADNLSLSLSSPAANGSEVLTVSVTSPTGTALGQSNVTVPNNGWWVVGLGPDSTTITTPIPVPTAPVTVISPSTGSGTGTGTGSGSTGTTGSSVTTPEPTSMMLLGFGGLTAAGWRLRRR